MISSKELIRSLRAMGGCWSEKGCAQHVKDNGDCDGCRDMLAAADLIERLDGALREIASGHHADTCSHMLNEIYDCDCHVAIARRHAFLEPEWPDVLVADPTRNARSGEGE